MRKKKLNFQKLFFLLLYLNFPRTFNQIKMQVAVPSIMSTTIKKFQKKLNSKQKKNQQLKKVLKIDQSYHTQRAKYELQKKTQQLKQGILFYNQNIRYMQQTGQALKNDLWVKLRVIFDKYAQRSEIIETQRVQDIVRDVFGHTTQGQIDYVIKNMFRLDIDGNGTVDFDQFANFVFKRHCGQMSLQKLHKQKKIKRWQQQLINLQQFKTLLYDAFIFLGVNVDDKLSQQIFRQADKNKDGHITYIQYFRYIEQYVCKPIAPSPDVSNEKKWNSLVRLHLWKKLQNLYEYFNSQKRAHTQNDLVLKDLVTSILGQLNPADFSFLLNKLIKLQKGVYQFVPFAKRFLYIVAQLHLNKYQTHRPRNQRYLNDQQFVDMLGVTYKFLDFDRIRRQLLLKLFGKADKNYDGLISFAQYLDWVRKHLAVDINLGEQYYVQEDDASLHNDPYGRIPAAPPIPKKQNNKITFTFSNYQLSDLVRHRIKQLLITFDKNRDRYLDKVQIQAALIQMLKQNNHQLDYVTLNSFRYDLNERKKATFDQFTDFCAKIHFGQMALQRLHKLKRYSRRDQKLMNEPEFEMSVNLALDFIGLKASIDQISTLFKQIDLDKIGWISYEIYFLFFRQYFSELRIQSDDKDNQWYKSMMGLDLFQRFVRIIVDQLRSIFGSFDANQNLLFEEDQIGQILRSVFGLNQSQVNYIIQNLNNFSLKQNKSLTFQQLVKILLQVYFVQIILKRKYNDDKTLQWKAKKISLPEFIDLVLNSCFFLGVKPSKSDLEQIFQVLDTDRDGFLSFKQYTDFIKKYLGTGFQSQPQKDDKQQISPEERQFTDEIYSELRTYFNKYDTGNKGYLTKKDLKNFVIEVLDERDKKQLDYIFWNLFRVDPNQDKKFEFNQFAPFILLHAGQIGLQRFHRSQKKGKANLSLDELFKVFTGAFSFLQTMPKSRQGVQAVYRRTGKGSDPTYSSYMSWIHKLAARFKSRR